MHRWCPVMLNALSKSFTCSLILILILILCQSSFHHANTGPMHCTPSPHTYRPTIPCKHTLSTFAVLLVGFAAFVFLLAGTIDEAWVRSSFDVEYSSGGGETSTGETVTKFGLTTSSATQPTFLTEIVSEFILTVSYPSGIAAQLVNAQNEATGGPTAVSGPANTPQHA